ncbi:MAG: Methionine aminopeptidase 1, mitochondrial [Desulfovibrio sp.]
MLTPIDYPARVVTIAREVESRGLDAYVVTRMAGLHYLVGAFMPWTGAVIVTAAGEARFVYWALDIERVKHEGWGMDAVPFGGGNPEYHDSVVAVLHDMGVAGGRVGFDIALEGSAQAAPGVLSACDWMEFTKRLPKATLENGMPCLEAVMLIKDAAEIERLRLAAASADAGFEAALQTIRPGVTENAVAGAVEEATRRHGSIWAWSVTGGTEVGSGPRTAFFKGLTQQATERKIQNNEIVIVDLHPMVELYIADLGLPVMLGKATREQENLMAAWEDAVATLMEGLAPGSSAKEACQKAYDRFGKYGLEAYTLPVFGHGLGTCARQRPFMSVNSTDIMREGMVLALGGHVYQPGVGGCRQEYPILIGKNGAEALCRYKNIVHRI